MSLQGWQETLITAQVDGTAVASNAVASLIPLTAVAALPANTLSIGKTLRIRAAGRLSCSTAAPTLQLGVKFGTVSAFLGGANALGTGGKVNSTWNAEIILTCRAIGSGTVANTMGIGKFICDAVGDATASNKAATMNLPLTAPAVGSGFDSTVSNAIDFTAQWGTSIASNTLTLHSYVLELLN